MRSTIVLYICFFLSDTLTLAAFAVHRCNFNLIRTKDIYLPNHLTEHSYMKYKKGYLQISSTTAIKVIYINIKA